MADIKTNYLGLTLGSPVIIAASPLTQTIDSLRKCEESGAGAVVLKSLFEEQIDEETAAELESNQEFLNFSDADKFFEEKTKAFLVKKHADLLKEAKKVLSIPVIASICCKSNENWHRYAALLVESGADAIELNYYPQTSDATVSGKTLDEEFESFVKFARSTIKCPLSIKMGSKYSGLANKIRYIDNAGVDGVVLFNRSYRQDIDIEKVAIVDGDMTTSGSEYTNSLRWTALMAGEIKMDIAANTGIADGETAIKMLLAGAKAVQVASVVMKKGYQVIGEMNSAISSWMDRHGYSSVSQFCGVLAQERNPEGYLWERSQFFKVQGGEN